MIHTPSTRLSHIPASSIRKFVPLAEQATGRGVHVYHLNIGDPDIQTPDVMIDVLHSWDKNPISYGQSKGDPALLTALSTYYTRLGFSFLGPSNIQVTTGGSEAISMALFATCNVGDEVLVFEPFYTNYNFFAVANGVRLIPIETTIQRGFHLPDKKEIEKKVTKRTKAILVCTPNNPTGTVYTKQEMAMLVGIAKAYGLFLLSDEVYREFCYDKKKQTSLLSFMQEIPRQAILLDSLSKRYSLCGARIGVLASLNDEIMAGVLRMAQGRLSSGLVDQKMAAQLTAIPDASLRAVHDEYEKRRNVLFEGLQHIPGVTVTKPEGAFYIIAGLPVADAEDFCRFLLTDFQDNNETVMLTPAAGFYATKGRGKNEVRMAYVIDQASLKRSVALIEKALKQYSHS